jgi:hypothetical protein
LQGHRTVKIIRHRQRATPIRISLNIQQAENFFKEKIVTLNEIFVFAEYQLFVRENQ